MFTYFNYNYLMLTPLPYIREYLMDEIHLWHVHSIFEDISSTNTFLKEQSASLSNRTIVLANQQNSGRGRFQRQFKSARDKGIYCSFLLKKVEVQNRTHLSFSCALAIAMTINDLYQIKVQIKWPNDLLLNKKKLAGILIETVHQAESMDVVIGFGLNVHSQDFEGLDAIALEDVYGAGLDRNEFLIHFFKTFDELSKLDNLMPLYHAFMIPIGSLISTTIQGFKTTLTIVNIQDDGTLLAKKEDGTLLTLFNEEIHTVPDL